MLYLKYPYFYLYLTVAFIYFQLSGNVLPTVSQPYEFKISRASYYCNDTSCWLRFVQWLVYVLIIKQGHHETKADVHFIHR